MNAIIRKELRDLSHWIPLCMIVVALLFWYAVQRAIMGVESELMNLGAFGFSLTAIFYGTLQSVFDARKEAVGFLIHRPVSKSNIFWGKFAAGLIAWAVSCGVPLLGVAIYLEAIGPESAPTNWKQTLRTVAVSVVAFSFYPTAMWIAWGRFWSRFLLLLLPFTAVCFVIGYTVTRELGLDWRLVAVVCGLLVVLTLGARHAFCNIQFSPGDQRSNSWMENISFSLICVVLAFFFMMTISAIAKNQEKTWYMSYAVNDNEEGELWKIRTTYGSGLGPTVVGKKAFEEGSEYGEMPDDFLESPAMYFSNWSSEVSWPFEFEHVEMIERFTAYNHDDRLYLYNDRPGTGYELSWVVTPQGFFGPAESPLGRFRNLRSVVFSLPSRSQTPRLQGGSLHFDESGVYQINGAKRTVTKLIDDQVDLARLLLPRKEKPAALWTRSGSQFKKYSLESTGDPFEPIPYDYDGNMAGYFQMPALSASLEHQWDDLEMLTDKNHYLSVYDLGDKMGIAWQSRSQGGIFDFKVIDSEGVEKTSQRLENSLEEMASNRYPETFLDYAVAPPWASASMLFNGRWPSNLLGAALAHGLVAVALIILLGIWLGLPIPSIIRWAIAAAILGVGIAMALWLIRSRPVREVCEKCESLRRVDRSRCKKCGAIWECPEPDGTEIIGPRPAGVEVLV